LERKVSSKKPRPSPKERNNICGPEPCCEQGDEVEVGDEVDQGEFQNDLDAESFNDNAKQQISIESLMEIAIVKPRMAHLPKNWQWMNPECHFTEDEVDAGKEACVLLTCGKGKIAPSKCIHILGNSLEYFIAGEAVQPKFLAETFNDLEELNNAIAVMDDCRQCIGCSGKVLQIKTYEGAEQKNRAWHSLKCETVVRNGTICEECSSLKKRMYGTLSRMERLQERMSKGNKRNRELECARNKIKRRNEQIQVSIFRDFI